MKSILYTIFILFVLSVELVTAQKHSTKIRHLENQRTELQKKIQETDKNIKKTTQKVEQGQQKISLLNKQVKQRESMLSLITKEIETIQVVLDSISKNIELLSKKESNLKDKYAKSVRSLELNNPKIDFVTFVLSSKTLEEAWARQQFISKYANAIKDNVDSIKKVKQEKELAKEEYNSTLKQKESLSNQKKIEKEQLEKSRYAQSKEVENLKKQEKQLKQIRQKQQRDIAILNQKIEAQIAKEIEESRRRSQLKRDATRKASEKNGKSNTRETADTKYGYAMDATEMALSGSFARNKGRLPMPVRGKYNILSHYGVHQHSEHNRVLTNNAGIDIQPISDNKCYAVFEGVITRIFITPGYNNSIIIRHGNYLTVYSNISQVYVRQGDKIKTGQPLGTISNDFNGNNKKLHFQIWHEQTKQNPEAWLKN